VRTFIHLQYFCSFSALQELIAAKEKHAKRDRDSTVERSKARKKKKKDEVRREKKKHRKVEVEKAMHYAPEEAVPITTSLSQLDWLWRSRQRCNETMPTLETVADYNDRKDIPLHPQFVEAGIVHQLPRMHSLVREHEFPNDIAGRVYDPPRQRHTERQYAQFCVRLMSCLQGPARLFATCEFFYSDIDRPWHSRSPFAAAASKLGVPKGATLTRREWSAVRRRMVDKPRRFSEKFIVAQLSDRNKYRNTVRKLQNNPHLAALEKFPFDVHAPIRPGTMVTAFSKRFRIIQRGRVLTFDRMTALYLIEFENGQFGYELCPDSDIATCGVPTVLIPAQNPDNNDICLGSSTGPLPGDGIALRGALSVNDYVVQTLGFTPVRSPDRAIQDSENEEEIWSTLDASKELEKEHLSLLETVAEHDSFLDLIETVDEARNRKEELLGLIADANALMVNSLPFGDGGSTTPLSSDAKKHLAWLRANLDQTNRVLVTAIGYLRTLFGDAYLTQ
jgi:DIRP